MSSIENYVCSAKAGCKKTFTKFSHLRRHEVKHEVNIYACCQPECDFKTLTKSSYDIHRSRCAGAVQRQE